MDSEVTVVAVIRITVSEDDLASAENDVAQAVQNAIGHTGAQVIDAEEQIQPITAPPARDSP